MTQPSPDRVAIVGVGLLGASLGLALKARGLATRVTGVGRRKVSLDTALALGAIDATAPDVAAAAAEADLLVVATPAALVTSVLDEVRRAGNSRLVVTDVASTKAAICGHAEATWAAPRRFVGSHPMAGGEKFGPENGRPDLYEDTVCLVEESPGLDPEAHAVVCGLWESVGARVVSVKPEDHDPILARTSHLPHVVASAVAALAGESGASQLFVGNGFRDLTRIADSRPEVWRDICLTNRTALLQSLAGLDARLHELADILAAGDAERLDAFFEQGREGRRKVLE
jgi:prephenate dehydrogenase